MVTGANGFIGRHLCSDLLRRGWEVLAAVRRRDAIGVLPEGVEAVVMGDVCETRDWTAVLRGVDAIAHLAGRAHVVRARADLQPGAYYEMKSTSWVLGALRKPARRRQCAGSCT